MCYASKGFFLMPNVAASLEHSYRTSKTRGFINSVVREIKDKKIKVLRVHVAGDLYDTGYAKSWLEIFKSCPECRFFLYTRSWRIKSIAPTIKKMAELSNVRLWLSVDSETGKPKGKWGKARLAFMQTEESKTPNYKVDLVFRDDKLREVVAKTVSGAMVCPVENGITSGMSCVKCGFCWRDRGETFDWSHKLTNNKRISLPTV